MNRNEIARVQDYLRRTFGTDRLTVIVPKRSGQPIEVMMGEEFLGVLYRDEDDGEVSYQFQMTILDIDLPPAAPAA
ncbi:DUF3126 family protein [Novispirillum sp. DQ9]|uniref:DUF3126 family protein n=1 Tax=Novispirillum sp. DQ9 TaxID=3398612 RepID=UPI003C7E8811